MIRKGRLLFFYPKRSRKEASLTSSVQWTDTNKGVEIVNTDGSTTAKTSDVPSTGSEWVHQIDGREYGMPPSRGFEGAPSPDGDDEVCGTHAIGLPIPWVLERFLSHGKEGCGI